MAERITIIGFGEAGRHFGRGLVAEANASVSAYDVRQDAEMTAAGRAAGVKFNTALPAALADAGLVFSLVTAASALDAARAAAKHLKAGQTYVDLNSVSPMTKN